MQDLAGKVALVTGAASGIGRGLIEALGAAGMRVVAVDLDETGLASLSETLLQAGTDVLTQCLDVRDRAGWDALLEAAEARFGPVQLLCNVAGVTTSPKPFLELTEDAWKWVNDINLNGVFHGAQTVARRLAALKLPGHIVNTASIQGLYAVRNFAPYNASKFAIVGLTETLRIELAALDIGVTLFCPGPVQGNIMRNSARLMPGGIPATGRARPEFDWAFKEPADIAPLIIDAVQRNRFYVFTHPEYAFLLKARAEALAASQALATPEREAKLMVVEAEPLALYQDVIKNRV